MNYLVSRTCTEIPPPDAAQSRQPEPRPLVAFRSAPAYVLLGDPGAGKTTAFEVESKAAGDGLYVSARDFLTLNVDAHPEWREKTLFIDGLDEVRAGTDDMRTPFDAIRNRLDTLGKPLFRLSCREADWLGANDRNNLASVASDGAVTVLRLDPLTHEDILSILDAQPEIDDAQKFVEEAQNRAVDGLLTNPQSLELLVRAVAEGGWPESRLDTFERACSHIARERNEEHLIGAPPSALDDLLEAAGRLCAVQLIAGIAGYAVGPGESDSAYPSPEECGYANRAMLKPALATKLFKAESDTRLIPVHRHIAEFLGARHLAKLIEGGLPSQRVLALITGADGGVVTEMRGLSAWLTARCQSVRRELIERDPIGVGLYGDLYQFSPDEKRALLNALKHMGDRLGSDFESRHWTAAFGPLVTASMEPVLKEILTDPARDEQHQMLAVFVLRILEEGPPLPGLSDPLLDIVRDNTRPPRVNALALDAFLHTCPDGQKTDALKQLLADIQAGHVADFEDELIGTLLTQLYPRDLPASEVWDYLSESKSPNLTGGSFWFWRRHLLEKSSDEDVAELLDRLLCPPSGVRHALEAPRPYLVDLVLGLLARGLQTYGEKIPIKQLYGWLGIGAFISGDHESARIVRTWLEQHPEIQEAIVAEGFQRAAQSSRGNLRTAISRVRRHLYGATPPADFGPWCGEQARQATDLKVAECFIRRAEQEGLSLEEQREQASDHPELQRLISEIIAQSKAEEQEYRKEERSYTEERKRQEEEWLAYVRRNEAALQENRADAVLLHELAMTWLDSSPFGPSDALKALRQKLRDDQVLLDAAFEGLRGVVDRDDLPESEKILNRYQKNEQYYLSLPFLVSLAEIERETPVDLSQWDDSRLRTALTFYFCTPFPGDKPHWYQGLLKTRPALVAEVQVQYARVAFRSGRGFVKDIQELAHDREYAHIARHASLPLLRAFPVRCKGDQLYDLNNLLWAAFKHGDRPALEELIGRKLSRSSMNATQRVYWLAAGLLVSPQLYTDCLSDFAQDHQSRIEYAATFFCDRPSSSQSEVSVELGIPVMKFLIRLIGSHAEPDSRLEEGPIPSSMKASRVVYTFVHRLATSPDQEASDTLTALCTDQALIGWQDVLKRARDSQRVVRRDAEYSHPNVQQVCETLRNGPPANAADLAALVIDRLHKLATRIRTGNTDDWRQYWNEPSGQGPTPKHEDHCRDALLSDLRQCIPPGVDAQPEGQYASDKRADIRVVCQDFQVPIEIKKSSHRELWRAIQNQLIAQYTIDPATGGHGIYLVFWFGRNYTRRTPDGIRPDSPAELKQQLELTLSEDEARKISVCVIDVSRPQQ